MDQRIGHPPWRLLIAGDGAALLLRAAPDRHGHLLRVQYVLARSRQPALTGGDDVIADRRTGAATPKPSS